MSESSARRPLTIILCCLIGAAALTLSAALLSRFMVRVQQRSENTISVKGVAERKIVSDLGAFTCSVWVDAPTVKDGYLELEKAYTRLYKALIARGFRDDEMCEQRLYYTRVTKTVRTVTVRVPSIQVMFVPDVTSAPLPSVILYPSATLFRLSPASVWEPVAVAV